MKCFKDKKRKKVSKRHSISFLDWSEANIRFRRHFKYSNPLESHSWRQTFHLTLPWAKVTLSPWPSHPLTLPSPIICFKEQLLKDNQSGKLVQQTYLISPVPTLIILPTVNTKRSLRLSIRDQVWTNNDAVHHLDIHLMVTPLPLFYGVWKIFTNWNCWVSEKAFISAFHKIVFIIKSLQQLYNCLVQRNNKLSLSSTKLSLSLAVQIKQVFISHIIYPK